MNRWFIKYRVYWRTNFNYERCPSRENQSSSLCKNEHKIFITYKTTVTDVVVMSFVFSS
jgi:GH43 family beta-xylosidase